MMSLATYTAIWLSIFVVLLTIASHFLIGFEITKFALDVLVFVVASYHTFNYLIPAMGALRRGAMSGSDKLNVQLWLVWLAYFLQRDWVILLYLNDRPQAWVESPIGSVLASVILIAGMHGAFAPVSDSVELPRLQVFVMIVSAVASGLIAGAIVAVLAITGRLPL